MTSIYKMSSLYNMMKTKYNLKSIPSSRIATFDSFAVGLEKHHVGAFLEFDVTESRDKIRLLKKRGAGISFTAWLIKVIAGTLELYPEAAAFLLNKRKLILFDDINISLMVEKKSGDSKVPMPVVIRQANKKNMEEITSEIENARTHHLEAGEIVIHQKSPLIERLYYRLPGLCRRTIWRFLLRHPKLAYPKMGNVMVTSIGMMGRINGWFITRSVHPVAFGIGSVIKKPVVIGDEIKIREILNMTVLVDHDAMDGAPMVRMLTGFTKAIETGAYLNYQR